MSRETKSDNPIQSRKPVTMHRLLDMSRGGEKIAVLTCYDAAFARVLNEAGVDV